MIRGGRVATAVIADDEELARRRILELLRERRDVEVIGQSASGPAAVDAVRDLSPDLLFLDVQMPGLDGFEVLARLEPEERPVVIFSTAYDEYALAAFEVNAVDYLLKPFADERFEEALSRAQDILRGQHVRQVHDRLQGLLGQLGLESTSERAAAAPEPRLERFAVVEGERRTIIEALSVDWIEAAGDYVVLHVGGKTHLLRGTMAALERRLDPSRFLRIHRSTIVQIERVKQLQPDRHGDYTAVLESGKRLRVGRRYAETALQRLGLKW